MTTTRPRVGRTPLTAATTSPAARAALAGVLLEELGDYAAEATGRILHQLNRDGWHITIDPRADVHRPPQER
ncbi:hypothetical protein F4556_005206 [Kitasatospora gansuensis]|uniref:Uncharacterized protein n=1 Tax=Kitasatospora gansuensis TaxID=258050 RepID=A0A7W7SFS7_9ACTN|nr:hypothetical protein [Kitasatospora gansuensis]MBB4949671.1 hypothetical protein [Kitasatospora gansuensis]